MPIWALADLHLSLSIPSKDMAVFGPAWDRYMERIADSWQQLVKQQDLVLLPGDISWASSPQEALIDLKWIDTLPGTKVLIKGNHDYWWSSLAKVEAILPPSLHLIQNNAFHWKGIGIAGARLWDSPNYSFERYIDFIPRQKQLTETSQEPPAEKEKIYKRELGRLEASLKQLLPTEKMRLAMTHYPPISATLEPSDASALFERYHVSCCAFGHLHNVRPSPTLFGEKGAVRYLFSACDYVGCTPILVME